MSVADWYPTLEKPAWTPSGAVIGGVWNVLYALIALAGWLAWREVGLRSVAMGLFGAQLALNLAWSVAFFTLRRPGLALVDILALEALVVATLVTFWRIRPVAGALLVPYAVWVAFAGVLNAEILRLNAG